MDNLSIKTIKINGVSAVNKANSGHPGIVLGAATMSHTLFTRHMKYDPLNPKWVNRDRFILSAGHGSALLYSQLRLLDLVSEKELKNFRQILSTTPGHPEFGWTKGVEATTGPLGQGLAMSVGIATAEKHLSAKFPEIDHFTYVICGDGDLQEGVTTESLSFAGHNKLSKLIILHDSNDIQLDNEVGIITKENLKMRMEAIGFHYQLVKNNTVEAIDKALINAKKADKPSFIEIKTIIGDGTPNQGTSAVHGAPIGNDIDILRKNIEWNEDGFFIPSKVKEFYQKTIFKTGAKAFSKWKPSPELEKFLTTSPIKINLKLDKNVATRVTSGKVIEYISSQRENWIGGSADLSVSTKAMGADGVFSEDNLVGRNILFGVREFGMGAIANGIALHSNLKPFVSTFFVFSDYMKPSIRLASIMKLPITYVFTHDSIFVGEDGPTHEPIEHIAMFRSLPGIDFIRPADEKEVMGAYEKAYNSKTRPTVIALTRQNIVSLEETSKNKMQKGPYKLVDSNSDWNIVASGSEVANAVAIAKEFNINAISISNTSLHTQVNWDTNKSITIEAASTYGLQKFGKYNIGIDSFGESGDGKMIYKHFKLDIDSLKETIKNIIK